MRTRPRDRRPAASGQLRFLTQLECRLAPSATWFPPSHFQFEAAAIGSSQAGASPLDAALAYLDAHRADFGLHRADLSDVKVTSQYRDADSGTHYIYLRQMHNGLEVANADFSIAVLADGSVFSAGGGFVSDLADSLSVAPVFTPEHAVQAAAAHLRQQPGIHLGNFDGRAQTFQASNTLDHSSLVAAAISLDPIPARLQFVPMAANEAMLAWQLIIRTPDGDHWLDLSVADGTGAIVAESNWVDDAAYTALVFPTESVQDGGFATVTDPQLPAASPFGWHDTNGVAGPEFTDTRGNNVDAHLDRNADDVADTVPPRTEGGATLTFSTAFNAAQDPLQLVNQNAAMVNLFYVNNWLHDTHFQYGFTEVAGNFQTKNYSGNGAGADAVQADAQDGSGTNNANFATPPDGLAPRMQQYLFTSATPDRDSDLDNGIIIHEYGHGVSNRLTGGPANSNALDALQSGGMGEGWSDFYALMFTQRASDVASQAYPMGTYALNQPPTGPGIRRRPYSFDMSIDPLTFDAYGTSGTTLYGIDRSVQVHDSGELWCSTLWDLNWLLRAKYGFDADCQTGWSASPGPANAGNKLTLKLVMDAMKLQPANPSFIQARDAILAADTALTGGANHFEIWTAFARRGLGELASTTDADSTDLTIDFTIPAAVLGLRVLATVPAMGSVLGTTPTAFTLNVSDPVVSSSLQASDLTVNGMPADAVNYTAGSKAVTFTFNSTPVTAQGLQTMQVAENAFVRASDADSVAAFTGNFRYDLLPLAVTGSNPANGLVLAPPLTQLEFNFNEPVDPASVNPTDLTIGGGTVTGATLLNSNQTIRFTLSGLVGEGIVTPSIAAGAIQDVFGNPNVAYSGNYELDFSTQPFAIPLAARSPRGSLVFDGNTTGILGSTADLDSFTLPLDAGQSFTLLVTPVGAVQPTIALSDPNGIPLGSAAASGVGKPAILQSIPAALAGTYTLTVGAASGSGTYSVRALLNAALELESLGGPTNDTLVSAQNIDGSTLTVADASRLAVLGRATSSSAVFASENFESGTLPANVSTFSSNSFGRIQVAAPGGVGNGSLFALRMDSSSNNKFALNEAICTANLTGAIQANLTFQHISFDDATHTLPATFTGHVNGDGVAISADGTTWHTILNAPTQTTWSTASINLVAAAAAAGISLGPNFQIKFQQYGKSSIANDGRGYDAISISGAMAAPDLYSFSLATGESAMLGLKTLSSGTVELKLLDSSGAELAAGTIGAANFDRRIANFTAAASGTFYARVSGTGGTDYNLVVTRRADFESEANNTAVSAQSLIGPKAVFGHVTSGNISDPFLLPGTVVAGPVILAGTALTLGFNIDGSFITDIGGIGIQYLGAEFVIPGSPVASFTVSANGIPSTNNAANGVSEIGNIVLTDISNGALKGLRMAGVTADNLRLERAVYFNENDQFATVVSRVTNLSAAPMTNVAVMENLDPDQNFDSSSIYETLNDIVQDGKFVRATGPADLLTIGLGSLDLRSAASAEGFDNRDPFEIIDSPIDPDNASDDIAIALAFNFGTLAPGAQASGASVMAFGANAGDAEARFASNNSGTVLADPDWYAVTMPAGHSVIQLRTATPGDGPGEFNNAVDPIIEVFDSTGTTLLATGVPLPDLRNESIALGGLIPGSTVKVRVRADGATSGEYLLSVATNPGVPVQSLVVNDGATQRSRLTRIVVNFSSPVDAATMQQVGAITLTRTAATASGTVGTIVDLSSGLIVSPASGMVSSVTLTFSNINSAGVNFGSLADGRWRLAIPNSGFLSLLNDPILRRLYGDANSDGTIDGTDLANFGAAFGATGISPFDFNNDLTVDALDFGEFGNRFGVTL